MRLRPSLGIPAYLVLALVCAWVSNAVAGPARRLSWLPKSPVSPVAATPQAIPAPSQSPAPAPAAAKSIHPSATPKVAPSSIAPVHDRKAELLSRFPALVNAAQADISGEDAAWLHEHGALFVDARRTAQYAEGHLPGAKSIPAWEDGLVEKVDQLALFTADLKLPVVIYCSGGDCHDSHLVAEKLWLAGFRNLRIYGGGYPDWEARKLTVTKGEKP